MGEHVDRTDIRPSPIAGTWYPAQPQVLRKSIESWLHEVRTAPLDGQPLGVIVPHAGHRYSGRVAAHAFAHLKDLQPNVVAVISPLHTPVADKIATTAHQAYSTPLGPIEVDQGVLKQVEEELQRRGNIELVRLRQDQEHALEIELPFLQVVLKEPFKLLPLMLRDQSQTTARQVGRALSNALRSQTALIVASSDLSHFYSQDVAKQLDGVMLQRIEAFDPHGVLEAEAQGVGFACGRGAIAAALWAADDLGADRARAVKYATSGDVTRDFDSVVGYGSAIITRSTKE